MHESRFQYVLVQSIKFICKISLKYPKMDFCTSALLFFGKYIGDEALIIRKHSVWTLLFLPMDQF